MSPLKHVLGLLGLSLLLCVIVSSVPALVIYSEIWKPRPKRPWTPQSRSTEVITYASRPDRERIFQPTYSMIARTEMIPGPVTLVELIRTYQDWVTCSRMEVKILARRLRADADEASITRPINLEEMHSVIAEHQVTRVQCEEERP
jgi:hypothetical protein